MVSLVVTHFFNLAVVNSYVLYKELGGNGSLVDFLFDICQCLMAAVAIPDNVDASYRKYFLSVRVNDVPDAIRLEIYNHWPTQDTTPQRCKTQHAPGGLGFFDQNAKYICASMRKIVFFHSIVSASIDCACFLLGYLKIKIFFVVFFFEANGQLV